MWWPLSLYISFCICIYIYVCKATTTQLSTSVQLTLQLLAYKHLPQQHNVSPPTTSQTPSSRWFPFAKSPQPYSLPCVVVMWCEVTTWPIKDSCPSFHPSLHVSLHTHTIMVMAFPSRLSGSWVCSHHSTIIKNTFSVNIVSGEIRTQIFCKRPLGRGVSICCCINIYL